MADVPEGVGYGRVRGFFVSYRADSSDPGEIPDQETVDGMVIFTPDVKYMRWPNLDSPRTAILHREVCPVINGELYPPGTTPEALPDEPGVVLVSTEQPNAEPNRVNWRATFQFPSADASIPPAVVPVVDGGVTHLSEVVPSSPDPGVIKVVSSEDRIAAEQARDEAEAARDQTEQEVVTGLSWSGTVDLSALADAPRMLGVTLTGDVTLTLPAVGDRAYTVSLLVTQDATGGHALMVDGRTAFGVPVALSESGTDLVHLLAAPGGWIVLMGAQGIEVPA